jgi:hypothetical protein
MAAPSSRSIIVRTVVDDRQPNERKGANQLGLPETPESAGHEGHASIEHIRQTEDALYGNCPFASAGLLFDRSSI